MNPIKAPIKFLTALCLSLALSACTSPQVKLPTESPEIDLAIKVAVWRVIDGDKDRQEKILSIVDGAGSLLLSAPADSSSDPAVAIASLSEYARGKINWSKLTIEEAALADYLLAKIAEQLFVRVESKQIDPHTLVVVNAYLQSIRMAALMAPMEE